MDTFASLRVIDGLVGSGQAMVNSLTVAGQILVACNTQVAEVGLRFPCGPPEARFVRDNANNDRKVDIADPIYIINLIFHHGPPAPCEDAADANDDSQIDSSDVVYLISYEFRAPNASTAPPRAFPDCGLDPTAADGLTCLDDQCGP